MAKSDKRLRPCPFCGAPGEIYTGRSFTERKKAFHTEVEALEWVTQNVEPTSTESGVAYYPAKRTRSYSRGEWVGWYNRPGFTPRCTEPGCIARSVKLYKTEQEAIVAWNGSQYHGK